MKHQFFFFIYLFRGQRRSETALYLALWLFMFAVPVLGVYFADASDANNAAPDNWQHVYDAWKLLGMFAVAFWVHNIFIAPLLVYRNKKWIYLALLTALFAAFTFYQCTRRPHDVPIPPKGMENRMHDEDHIPPQGDAPDKPAQPRQLLRMGDKMPPERPNDNEARPMEEGKPHPSDMDKKEHRDPPMAFGGEDSVALVIMALLLGLNVGAKYFFKSLDDRKRFKALERENLANQLEYLKYQINPHFFMNTLNNIHALVDIDPEQAKQTIEVLSRLMRYMLYDGSKRTALLKNELTFIDNYVRLMRIRYNDNVRIDVSLPENVSDVKIPPLLFIIFVENAFKHGISYERPSFIEVKVTLTDDKKVSFLCRNSRKPSSEDVHGGIGLANATKRLKLLYGKDYELDIHPTTEEYTVQLTIPVL